MQFDFCDNIPWCLASRGSRTRQRGIEGGPCLQGLEQPVNELVSLGTTVLHAYLLLRGHVFTVYSSHMLVDWQTAAPQGSHVNVSTVARPGERYKQLLQCCFGRHALSSTSMLQLPEMGCPLDRWPT
jgi:hypothetical protein